MQLTSKAFTPEGAIPSQYTCDGSNTCPTLEIVDVPENAKSLALIFDDPDAPGGTFLHWTIWNIPPYTETIESDLPEDAIEGRTSFGDTGYGGPCPPDGEHRYYFRLYALDTELSELPEGASREELEVAMEGHIIEKAELMGRYDRSQT